MITIPHKTKRALPKNPRITLLGIYNIYSCKACTWMLIVALFVIHKTRNQVKCPSTEKWLNKPNHGKTIPWNIIWQ